MKKPAKILTTIITCLWLLCACDSVSTTQQSTEDESSYATAAVQTARAKLTEIAVETLNAQNSQTPAMNIAAPPVDTPTPTITPIPPSPMPPDCNQVSLIGDVSIIPGTSLLPGEKFIKTWRIQNTGTCTWSGDYALVFTEGKTMDGPGAVDLSATIPPDGIIDLSLKLAALEAPGSYSSRWKLQASDGSLFGIGENNEEPLIVDIDVIPSEQQERPDVVLDFTKNHCSVLWLSNTGTPLCEAVGNAYNVGNVYRIMQPLLEGRQQENEPALVTIPGGGDDGMITGRYPPVLIKRGYQFHAWIGCLENSGMCDVTFHLDYSVNGETAVRAGSWQQYYDGSWGEVSVDLGALAGQMTELILVVENNGSSQDDTAFWFAPVLVSGY